MAGKLSDRLKAAATKTTKSKSGSANHVLTGQEALVDKVITLKKKLADAEVEYAQVEQQLTDAGYTVYDQYRSQGQYDPAVFAKGIKTNGAMIIWSDKFSTLDSEMEAELRAKDPNYAKHFVEVRELKVKKDAGKTISDATIEKLMTALGPDFENIFDVKVALGTVKGFAEMWNEVPDSVKDVLKQAKPSVRNVTEDGKVC